MVKPSAAFADLPEHARQPLLNEYKGILTSFYEHRWAPAELSGGRFCEASYNVLAGHAAAAYPDPAPKISDFVGVCRKLESNKHEPRSFQILIPRMLPPLYEIRNNRNVGHIGGDVDPSQMDASAVVSISTWVMSEFARVFHKLSIDEAQGLVDALSERPMPLVWAGYGTKRILDADMKLREQVLVFLSSSLGEVPVSDLTNWTDYKNSTYLLKLVKQLDSERLIYFNRETSKMVLTPTGSRSALAIVARYAKH